MSFLLRKKLEHEARCEAAVREDRFADAVFHAAKAAEFCLALARQTGAPLAERYTASAEGWIEIGERIRKESGRCAAKRSPAARKAARDNSEDGSDPDVPDWLVSEKPSVTFAQIAGMEDAKTALREMIVYPLKDLDAMRALRLKAGGGLLLYGPPGTGKTSLAKAAANEIEAKFFYASGAEIRSKWHGESEQRLRKLIQAARTEPVSILFLDDVDGLLPRRGGYSVVDNRIVTQFLAEVGGFEDSRNVMMLLGATNKPWEIDEAVFRTQRFDAKLYVGLPDLDARACILDMHLNGVPMEAGVDLAELARRLDGFTGSDVEGIVNAAKRRALGRRVRDGTALAIKASDFDEAFGEIPKSVTERMLKEYAEFRDRRF